MLPELVAHRGWTRRYVENTVTALQAALAVGAPYVELDVQLSRDGVPFLFHDRDLERICGVSGPLHERSADDLDALRASEPERFGTQFQSEPLARLATLPPLLEAHPGSRAFVELKRASIEVFGPEAVLDAVLPILESVRERCCLISFDHAILTLARARGGWSVGPVLDEWAQLESPELIALAPEFVFCNLWRLPDEDPIRIPSGILAVYEVDDPALARALGARGVGLVETFAVGEMLAALEAPGGPE